MSTLPIYLPLNLAHPKPNLPSVHLISPIPPVPFASINNIHFSFPVSFPPLPPLEDFVLSLNKFFCAAHCNHRSFIYLGCLICALTETDHRYLATRNGTLIVNLPLPPLLHLLRRCFQVRWFNLIVPTLLHKFLRRESQIIQTPTQIYRLSTAYGRRNTSINYCFQRLHILQFCPAGPATPNANEA